MAEVVLNNVRKNYDPAVHKDTLRNINLAIKAHFEALAGRDIYDIVGQPTARK